MENTRTVVIPFLKNKHQRRQCGGKNLVSLSIFRNSMVMFVLLTFTLNLSALQPQDYVSNPLLNERAKSLYQQLKCPVCQGQSIAESDADMAVQMREEVRRLLQSGLSDIEIRDTFAENMGEDVLLQPSFGARSFVLWLTPLIAGIIFILFAWRRFHFNQYRKL